MPMLVSQQAIERPIPGIYRKLGQNDEAQTSAEGRGFMAHWLTEVFRSVFWENKARFDDARVRLSQACVLQPGWDTYGSDPPNEIATTIAKQILALLEAESLPPSRLLPSSEGGIAISFVKGPMRAGIEIYNSGEIAAATYTQQDQPIVWELDGSEAAIKDTIEQIRVRFSA